MNDNPSEIRDLRDVKIKRREDNINKIKSVNWFSIFEKIIIVIVGYGIYFVFGKYAIFSMVISCIFYFMFFKEFMTIPIRTFLKINVDTREISKVIIPWKKYKEFKKEGLYNPFSNIEVIKDIDIENKKIFGFWFSEINEVEFLIKVGTLQKLAEQFKEWLNKYASSIIITDVVAYEKAQDWLMDLNKMLTQIPEDKEDIFNRRNNND